MNLVNNLKILFPDSVTSSVVKTAGQRNRSEDQAQTEVHVEQRVPCGSRSGTRTSPAGSVLWYVALLGQKSVENVGWELERLFLSVRLFHPDWLLPSCHHDNGIFKILDFDGQHKQEKNQKTDQSGPAAPLCQPEDDHVSGILHHFNQTRAKITAAKTTLC